MGASSSLRLVNGGSKSGIQKAQTILPLFASANGAVSGPITLGGHERLLYYYGTNANHVSA
jgi:hypothetical protein